MGTFGTYRIYTVGRVVKVEDLMRFGGWLCAGSIPSVSQMQNSSQDADDTPSCPLSKFITTEASQGGVIALTTIKITPQHNIVSFSQATACRQILWSDVPWTGGEIEPARENYYESRGYIHGWPSV